jgi:transposase
VKEDNVLTAILAERVDAVIGVDAHTDTHTAAVLTPLGAVVAECTVSADEQGATWLLAWGDRHTGTGRRAWVVDGTRSHGVGLTRRLRAAGETVIEAARVKGAAGRRGGKSDALDAIHVARVALAAAHVATPRCDGDREALRILTVCRRHYTDTRTATVNLLKSLILTADDELRSQLGRLSTARQVRYLIQLSPVDGQVDTLTRVRRQHLHHLAVTIHELDRILYDNRKQIHALVTALCPRLLDQPGVGPVSAATALIAWSHKDRLRNEAAFAALAGVNPIPASSGRTTRHRLNRGGDRTLNAALHTIAKTRRRCHPPTQAYVSRRTAEGRTTKEINRCLKRYLARQLFRIMEAVT